jgi:hypothetical protein
LCVHCTHVHSPTPFAGNAPARISPTVQDLSALRRHDEAVAFVQRTVEQGVCVVYMRMGVCVFTHVYVCFVCVLTRCARRCCSTYSGTCTPTTGTCHDLSCPLTHTRALSLAVCVCSELLAEAVPESLKNILLVMSDSGVLRETDGEGDDYGLWRLTWHSIARFWCVGGVFGVQCVCARVCELLCSVLHVSSRTRAQSQADASFTGSLYDDHHNHHKHSDECHVIIGYAYPGERSHCTQDVRIRTGTR